MCLETFEESAPTAALPLLAWWRCVGRHSVGAVKSAEKAKEAPRGVKFVRRSEPPRSSRCPSLARRLRKNARAAAAAARSTAAGTTAAACWPASRRTTAKKTRRSTIKEMMMARSLRGATIDEHRPRDGGAREDARVGRLDREAQVEEARLAAGQGARRKAPRNIGSCVCILVGAWVSCDLGRRAFSGVITSYRWTPADRARRSSSCNDDRVEKRRQARRRRGGRRLLRFRARAYAPSTTRTCVSTSSASTRPRAKRIPARSRGSTPPSRGSSARSLRSRRHARRAVGPRDEPRARALAQRRRVGVRGPHRGATSSARRCSARPAR